MRAPRRLSRAPDALRCGEMTQPSVRVGSTSQLFVDDEPSCDACGESLAAAPDEDGPPRGEGALLWFRDGTFREEKRPLCPSCAATIGMTALSRWASEEDEG